MNGKGFLCGCDEQLSCKIERCLIMFFEGEGIMKKLVFLVIMLVFVGSTCADITTGLVGWWKLDEVSGNVAVDSSGFGNNGTIGSADTWIAGGGLDFSGGAWGASGIVFPGNGGDVDGLIDDMDLSSAVTISFIMSGHTPNTSTDPENPNGDRGYAFSGTNAASAHIMSAEAPSGSCVHFLTKMGNGGNPWCWEAFNPDDSRYIFAESDARRITIAVDFTAESVVYYLEGDVWASGSATGSFAGLTAFTIGRQLWAEYDAEMEDFRIYDRALSADDVAELPVIPEPATIALLGFGGLALIRRKKS